MLYLINLINILINMILWNSNKFCYVYISKVRLFHIIFFSYSSEKDAGDKKEKDKKKGKK